MRVKLEGINTIKRRLANGELRTYYYHRATGARLDGTPGSPNSSRRSLLLRRAQRPETLEHSPACCAISRGTAKWRKLADSTRTEYRRVFQFWEYKYGTCPFAALEDKAFRRAVLKWHDAYSAEKPREADNRVTILARVLSWATKDGPLKANVLDGFDRAYQGDRSEMIWLPETCRGLHGRGES